MLVWIVAFLIATTGFEGMSRLPAQDTATEEAANPTEIDAGALEFFEQEVLPILVEHCHKCHGPKKQKGGLRLNHRSFVLAGGDTGPAVDANAPTESLLLAAINYGDLEMPPTGKLPQAKIDVLTKWVTMGLPWTPGEVPQDTPSAKKLEPPVDDAAREFWSFRARMRPEVPTPENLGWVQNPIDAFVLSRLETASLAPAPPAAKHELLRRAYYDLTGLPPTPAQVQAFLQDERTEAFEEVVDQLLESPHYGEKWARHWLDIVRYAETNSYERDSAKPNIWRYRDYVIRSLNEDKPFDVFTREQLAGDELDEVTNESIIATGYFRLGTWQDEPVDGLQELYEDLDDMTRTTGEVFLGLTVGCARCHNHKLDPFPQRDYYRLLAFFSGIDRSTFTERPIASVAESQSQQKEIAAHQVKVEALKKLLEAVEKRVYDDFKDVEKEEFQHEQHKIAIVKKRVPKILSEAEFQRYVTLKEKEKELKKFQPTALRKALAVREIGRNARETFVLVRGNAHVRDEKVEPGFPEVLGFPDPTIQTLPEGINSSGRRRVLADWITDPKNPLPARVMANRIWQHHFGRGIVRSPNNFGFHGIAPTHPELLDWLASELIDGEWKLKRMHKMIMLSNAYQMSSRANPQGLAEDPENNLWWRFEMRRLSAEELRDTIFAVNGSLNPKMYGRPIYPEIPAEVKQGQSRPGSGWGNSSPEERARRSIYIHIKRGLIVPMMAAFDVADADASCPVRFVTTQPTQALGMLNSAFVQRQAKVFAEFVSKQAAEDDTARVRLALLRACQRTPTASEIERGVETLRVLRDDLGLAAEQALEHYCLLVLNLNEMIYLD